MLMKEEEINSLIELRKVLCEKMLNISSVPAERLEASKRLTIVDEQLLEYKYEKALKTLQEIELTNDKSRRQEWRNLKKFEKYAKGKLGK